MFKKVVQIYKIGVIFNYIDRKRYPDHFLGFLTKKKKKKKKILPKIYAF